MLYTILYLTFLIGFIFTLKPLLARIVQFPLTLEEVKPFLKKLNILIGIVAVLTVLAIITGYLPDDLNIVDHPLKYLLIYFLIIVPIAGLSILSAICPNCKKFIFYSFEDECGVTNATHVFDYLKISKCRYCQFTYKEE